MIEESGENWYYVSTGDAPPSIQVLAMAEHVERTQTVEHPAKRKKAKQKPFGFARALPKQKKAKRGRKT